MDERIDESNEPIDPHKYDFLFEKPAFKPLETPQLNKRRDLMRVAIGVAYGLAVFFVIAIYMATLTPNADRPSRPVKYVLRDTPAATNEKVFSRLQDLAVAGDYSGIDALNNLGLVMELTEGTEILIINLGFFSSEIKVESGPHAGKYLIVTTSDITH